MMSYSPYTHYKTNQLLRQFCLFYYFEIFPIRVHNGSIHNLVSISLHSINLDYITQVFIGEEKCTYHTTH